MLNSILLGEDAELFAGKYRAVVRYDYLWQAVRGEGHPQLLNG
jgi:hypothetical protein